MAIITGLAAMAGLSLGALCSQDEKLAEPHSVWEGVYNQEQAKRGQALYDLECASCHGDKLKGDSDTPSLAGDDFLTAWNGSTLNKLFDKIRLTMPRDKPSRVGLQQKTDILAYILSVNQFPAGKAELPPKAELLQAIRFESKQPQSQSGNGHSHSN